jgi:UDP-glucose-4-epimerase GalE
MTVLVTGGAGYIGSHTARWLRRAGRDVVVLDSLELGYRAAVEGFPLVVGDIADRDLVARVVEAHGVDACIHFAAYKNAGESMLRPDKYFGNNTAGSHALVDALERAGVRRIVFSSTCAVYGTPEVSPVAETAPLHPESPYGESKLMVERILDWYDRIHGVRSVSLRYFNAAGASPDGDLGEDWAQSLNLVPVAIKAALGRRDPLLVFGTDYPTPDGTATRDYIHVDDLAAAHLAALELLERGGATTAVNLGTGIGSSVRQVLDAIEAVAGRPVPHTDTDRRPGDPVQVYADNSRAREVLGWTPRYDLAGIVATAWQWHAAHLDGFSR